MTTDVVSRADVAVLIPAYNCQEELLSSLNSLVDPTAPPFDVVVIDDGSSPPLTIDSGTSFPVHLIRLEENRGIVDAMNAGLDFIAQHDYTYIARLDAGDINLSGRLGQQVRFLDQHPEFAVVGSYAEIVEENGSYRFLARSPTDSDDLRRSLLVENPLCHPTVMLRMAAIRQLGGYSPAFPGSEDYELWRRLSRHWKIGNLSKVLVRKVETSRSITAGRWFHLGRLRIQLAYFEWRSPLAYAGVVRTCIAMSIPMIFKKKVRSWLDSKPAE